MKRYKQKFRDMWLQMSEFRIWLRRDPEDSYKARCRFCKCLLNTKISELRSHAMTQKHLRKTSALDIKRNESVSIILVKIPLTIKELSIIYSRASMTKSHLMFTSAKQQK